MGKEILTKYNLSPKDLLADESEWQTALEVLSKLREITEATNSVRSETVAFRQSTKVEDNRGAKIKADELLGQIESLILESGILSDSAALHHLSTSLKNFNNFTSNIIDFNLNQQRDSQAPSFEHPLSKKQASEDYNELRTDLMKLSETAAMIGVLEEPIKIPPMAGRNFSDNVPTRRVNFDQYDWIVNGVIYNGSETPWWTVASAMGFRLLPISCLEDWVSWLNKHFGINLYRSGEFPPATFYDEGLKLELTVAAVGSSVLPLNQTAYEFDSNDPEI